ncbi:MAG: tRNA lysidine(34) synthetase TilS [Chitinophagaceae bacterium]|nr:tRNA lysidine(34) synthetase TilS [Chitinophagaceae bacterium]
MSLLEKFQESVQKQKLFLPQDTLLLAVSGGVDSVVLCALCQLSGFQFSIAHCNFQLRGEESERDELFVKALAKKYNVAVDIKKFDTEKYAATHKIAIQEAARNLRYEWFAAIAAKRYIVTAHHADDNAETILMHFFRGTGLSGLTGIPAKNKNIRRPLLPFSKAEMIDFAKENKLDFVEDSSNQTVNYTRNLFRLEILPLLRKVFPAVDQNLQQNIYRFSEIEKLYQFSVGKLLDKICVRKNEEVRVPVKQLMQLNNRALIYELIRPFHFTEKQIEEVIKLSSSESGRYLNAPDQQYQIVKHRHWFIIHPLREKNNATIVITENENQISFANGALTIDVTDKLKIPSTVHTALLDIEKIEFPLVLRRWKEGDYFYPLGLKKKNSQRVGKKKIARFLIDAKLPKSEKDNIWVIESNQKICWVVGHRIDERFKITPRTKKALRIQWQSK